LRKFIKVNVRTYAVVFFTATLTYAVVKDFVVDYCTMKSRNTKKFKLSLFCIWITIGFIVLLAMVITIICIADSKMSMMSSKLLFHPRKRIERSSLHSRSDRNQQFNKLYEQVLREYNKVIILTKTHNPFVIGIKL